jgi:hypothetical protein
MLFEPVRSVGRSTAQRPDNDEGLNGSRPKSMIIPEFLGSQIYSLFQSSCGFFPAAFVADPLWQLAQRRQDYSEVIAERLQAELGLQLLVETSSAHSRSAATRASITLSATG